MEDVFITFTESTTSQVGRPQLKSSLQRRYVAMDGLSSLGLPKRLLKKGRVYMRNGGAVETYNRRKTGLLLRADCLEG